MGYQLGDLLRGMPKGHDETGDDRAEGPSPTSPRVRHVNRPREKAVAPRNAPAPYGEPTPKWSGLSAFLRLVRLSGTPAPAGPLNPSAHLVISSARFNTSAMRCRTSGQAGPKPSYSSFGRFNAQRTESHVVTRSPPVMTWATSCASRMASKQATSPYHSS